MITTAYILSVYSGALTLVWGAGKLDILATTPMWFARRGREIAGIGRGLRWAFLGIRDLTPDSWLEIFRYLIPVLVFAACIAGIALLGRSAWIRLKEWNMYMWNCYRRDEHLLKWGLHGVISAVSLLIALTVAEYFPDALNWVSWFLLFSTSGNLIYHAAGKIHNDHRTFD